MSENLNRSTPDFSKYDSMSIGELEEILRADAQGPERDDSDVDEILYVMEVLAKKRRENGTAGKTALEAYQEFQQHYLPMVEEESQPRRKSNVIPFRRIAAVAACLVLVFSLSITANAFSFRDVWNAVVTWAQETFSFSMGVEVSEPRVENELKYTSFQEALSEFNVSSALVPSFIPEGFLLTDIKIEENPIQRTYIALYDDTTTSFTITIRTFSGERPEQVEKSSNLIEQYSAYGVDYYIFANKSQNCAVWLIDKYECSISGQLDVDTIKTMIESIGKD